MKKLILVGVIVLAGCAGKRAATGPVTPVTQPARAAAEGDHLSVAFSSPSRPGLVRVSLLTGSISVKVHNGKDVIIDTETRERQTAVATTGGLHRLSASGSGLQVEEQNNEITVQTDSFRRPVRINLQVPARTNLKLQTVNGGVIEVEGVEGDIDLENTNGRITARDVAGTVNAHSVNGGVLVTMRVVASGKPMFFGTQNGAIDVTLPPDYKANAKMRTDRGSIWTDFDIQTKPAPAAIERDSRSEGGTYRLQVDNNVYGTINGGGPDLTLTSFNGSIYIRRRQ
jgi:hypothetical protein